jgi:hypothetical protein
MNSDPSFNYFLAVAGAIPLLLVAILAENRLEFKNETQLGRATWFLLLASVIVGEIAALRALAWPPGGTPCFILATVGLILCLVIILLLFTWQVETQIVGDEFSATKYDVLTGIAVAAVILVGGGFIVWPLLF